MLVFPNCKINLGLSIVEKRIDGFHNIETVFYPIPLFDVLEIISSENGKTEFFSTGLPIQGDTNKNLCLKAYQLLKNDFDLPPVKIYLHKIIPMGAGLGGGSSDGAHALILLNELFELKLTQAQLLNYASKLGADCAFFILNNPVFAYEKGDRFNDISLNLNDYDIVVVKPQIHVATAEAYASITPNQRLYSINKLIEKPLNEWKFILQNDFEENIFRKYPEIEKIKNKLYESGAVYASMSGSGSAVFALFEKPVDLVEKFEDYFYWSSKI